MENFPGFPEGIQGPELTDNMRVQAERFGAELVHGVVTAANLKKSPIELTVGQEWCIPRR